MPHRVAAYVTNDTIDTNTDTNAETKTDTETKANSNTAVHRRGEVPQEAKTKTLTM